MSGTGGAAADTTITTHVRGAESQVHPITGEAPGIRELLERRSAQEQQTGAPDGVETTTETPPGTSEDPAEAAAAEVKRLRQTQRELEGRLASETAARQTAERAVHETRQQTEDSNFTTITTALASAEREQASLKAEMKTAGDAGDFNRVGDIAGRLGELGAEIRDLQAGKQEYEQARDARLNNRDRAPPAPTRTQPAAGDPTERQILNALGHRDRESFLAGRTVETAAWLRDHPQFFTDLAVHRRVVGADTVAQGEGYVPDTPEYFRRVEAIAMPQQTNNNRQNDNNRQTNQRTQVPSAPPSRDRAPSLNSGDVIVSADDRAAAEWMGVDPVEYAAENARLRRSGELPYRRR